MYNLSVEITVLYLSPFMQFPWLALIPMAVGTITQLIKFGLRAATHDRGLTWRDINHYGGFPSAHTAFTISLVTLAFLVDGANSLTFAIALVIFTITVRDALGVRMFLSEHATMLNAMVDKMPPAADGARPYPRLEEHLGHKPHEAIGGAVVGVILTVALYLAVGIIK